MRNKWLNTLVKVLLAAGLAAGLFVSYLLLSEMGAEVDALSMERCGSHILTACAAARKSLLRPRNKLGIHRVGKHPGTLYYAVFDIIAKLYLAP